MLQQRGASVLAMVVMILLAGSLLLQGSQRQLSAGIAGLGAAQRFVRQFADASSALHWGAQQRWRMQARWHCQVAAGWPWRACLRLTGDGEALLRGDSGPGTLALWHWVTSQSGSIRLQPQGWIDYCPLQREADCGPE